MGNMKFEIFQNADWGCVDWWDSWIRGMEENKKSASPKKNCAYSKQWRIVCVKGGIFLPVDSRHNRPRLIALISLSPSCASGFAFRLHGVFHDMPSPMALLLWVWVWRGWGKRWRGMRVFGVLISRHGIGWLGCRYFTMCFLPWKM